MGNHKTKSAALFRLLTQTVEARTYFYVFRAQYEHRTAADTLYNTTVHKIFILPLMWLNCWSYVIPTIHKCGIQTFKYTDTWMYSDTWMNIYRKTCIDLCHQAACLRLHTDISWKHFLCTPETNNNDENLYQRHVIWWTNWWCCFDKQSS